MSNRYQTEPRALGSADIHRILLLSPSYCMMVFATAENPYNTNASRLGRAKLKQCAMYCMAMENGNPGLSHLPVTLKTYII